MVRRVVLVSAFFIATSWAPVVWAQATAAGRTVATFDGTGANAWSGNIRASDDQLTALFEDGVKKSPTFRGIVERLSKSDVILYVRPDVTVKGNAPTKLTFLVAKGGYRYLVIRVAAGGSKDSQLAMLGHEMQHAVAIADAPSVQDSVSLKREFERIGKVSQSVGDDFIFDNPAADEAKRKILSELSSASSRGAAVATTGR